LPFGVESNVEQYFEYDLLASLRLQPGQGFERLWCRNGSALERNDTCIDVRQGGLLGNTEKLSSTQTALPWDSRGQGVRNVAGAGKIISNHSEKHRSHSEQTVGQTAARLFKNPFLRNRLNEGNAPSVGALKKIGASNSFFAGKLP
jgi:hypothetical protein